MSKWPGWEGLWVTWAACSPPLLMLLPLPLPLVQVFDKEEQLRKQFAELNREFPAAVSARMHECMHALPEAALARAYSRSHVAVCICLLRQHALVSRHTPHLHTPCRCAAPSASRWTPSAWTRPLRPWRLWATTSLCSGGWGFLTSMCRDLRSSFLQLAVRARRTDCTAGLTARLYCTAVPQGAGD